ncbi:MAG TPA: helix-hairpin-helix domain-containing protein [Bacteroidota bacterium]
MWQRLVDWLALTATERKVILFLAVALLAGMSIRLVQDGTRELPPFDYRTSDSVFAALSAALDSDTLGGNSITKEFHGKVNINAATDVQLESLPGIGAVLAERILRHRETYGPFQTAEELLKIKGITKKRLEQIKDFITIDRPISSLPEE